MNAFQEKVHQELDEIFQGEQRPITPQDVLKMQYLDKVIKESQRVIPVVPVIARTLDQDLKIGEEIFNLSSFFSALQSIQTIKHHPNGVRN